MSQKIGKSECFFELNDELSKDLIPKFRDVFYFFKKNAVDKDSLIRKLHLGYTAMRPEAFDFVAAEFPWLEEFRLKYGLTKKLNFLETNGTEKPEFLPHIDGKLGELEVMFNAPILNCTPETVTYWVEPKVLIEPILLCENGSKTSTAYGATPHLPPDTEYSIITSHSFTDKCALFRSNVYHGVKNNSQSDDYRIMMHWWFPADVSWNNAMEKFS